MIGAPSIFKLTRIAAALARLLPTFAVSCVVRLNIILSLFLTIPRHLNKLFFKIQPVPQQNERTNFIKKLPTKIIPRESHDFDIVPRDTLLEDIAQSSHKADFVAELGEQGNNEHFRTRHHG